MASADTGLGAAGAQLLPQGCDAPGLGLPGWHVFSVGRVPAVCRSHLRPGESPAWADRMSPPYHGLRWGSSLDPSCHHQGRGRKPWLPVFTRQLRRRQPVQRPWVRSAVRSSGQSGDGGRGRPQTKCPRGAGEMRPGAAAVISVTSTRGTAARGSGCSADAAETLQF